ncbi:MAG: hypothetical protein CVU69_10090 [Deltaproteobacteria bacterium HGW-Deltaproteobacteria-4]|nr:MAG: hypothetical protein CVU69_10090 [Deltaproteobacteria bacterium HGW-Deltaproteobacteria-4]
MMRRFLVLLFCLVTLPLTAGAFDVPPVQGYVNDFAGLLSPAAKSQIENFLRNFEASDSTQVVVVTVPNLQGEPIDMVALQIAETWKIGQKGKDNGALLLIGKEDRKMRIEVGRGLEGQLTDLLAGRIVDNEIAPRFKQGDFEGGIAAGVNAIVQSVRGEYKGTGKTGRKKNSGPWWVFPLLFFVLPLLGRLNGSGRGRHSGGYWVGGGGFGSGGGGGGFSGGGGGFSGGGSSGSW